MAEKDNYLKQVVQLVFAIGLIVGGITTAFFGMVGYYYGQGIVEQDLLGDRYKYVCLTNCDTPATATYNTSAELASYTAYQASVDSLNGKIDLLLTGVGIAFTVIGLFMLMQVVKSFKSNDGSGKKSLY